MSHDMLSKNFEMLMYDGIQYLDQSNVSQFTQNNSLPTKGNLSYFGQNYSTSCFMIHSARIFLRFFWHNGAQYIDKSNVNFPKKNLLLEHYRPNLAQKYTTCIINCSDF